MMCGFSIDPFSSLQQKEIMKCRRVVVTGLGLVTPLGVGQKFVWKRLLKGGTGVSSLKGHHHLFAQLPCQVAALVPRGDCPGKLNMEKIPSSSSRTMSTATVYALLAADEALEDSQWRPSTDEDRDSTGVALGMGMSPIDDILEVGTKLHEEGYSKVNPHFVPRILTNLAAGHISIKHRLRGPNHSVSTACATGAHAIGDAFRLVSRGDADVMVCGGTEACVNPLAVAGFSRMRALSTRFNERPSEASRPFDVLRDGFVMGEGAGVVVLEEHQHAVARNAKMYAEILGYGLSGDGHHVTAPSPDGRGAFLCMRAALRDARISSSAVGYINTHATSTPLGDVLEIEAIQRLRRTSEETSDTSMSVSSTKGATGHLLGAAGAVEAIFTILTCYTGVVPPTTNLSNPDTKLDLDGLNLVSHVSQTFPPILHGGRRVALNNSFGFGGTNACLCFASIE